MESRFDFSETAQEPFVGQFIQQEIATIYKSLTDKNVDALTSDLVTLRTNLIAHFTRNSVSLKSYPFTESAKHYFSHFLQHFLYSVLKMDFESTYKSQILNLLLVNHKDNFYYQFNFNEQKIVALWADKVTEDTALTAVCQRSDCETLDKLLDILKRSFSTEASRNVIPSELEQYLFHENKLGRSALSLIWLRQVQTMENSLFDFSRIYYQDLYSKSFEKFLFHIDSEGNTALMRAAARSSIRLVPVIINNLTRIFLRKNSVGFRNLLLHENSQGETVAHKIIQTQQVSQLKFLLKQNLDASIDFRSFFLLDKQPKKTLLIEAVKVQNKEIIDILCDLSTNDMELELTNFNDLLIQQDTEGYTALMRAVEINYREGVNYFLNRLLNSYWMITEYDFQPILAILKLKQHPIEAHGSRSSISRERLTIFQLAAKTSKWEILEELIDTVELVSGGDILLTQNEISYVDENGINTLTRLFREERDSRILQISGRQMSTRERKERHRRLKLARILAKLGERSPEKTLVPGWVSMEESGTVDRVINFFSIFCSFSASPQGKKRSITNHCFFSEKDYKVSLSEEPLQQYKESLINILAVIKQKNLGSIEQVSIIRNKQLPSQREKNLLEGFSRVIAHYYNAHAVTIIATLKENIASTLEAAFAANKPYILVDSQKDLLLIKNNAVFSGTLLNPIKFFSLDPTIKYSELKIWLDSYFGSSYTLHPFESGSLDSYPDVLDLDQFFISDSEVLSRSYRHIKYQILRELYLLNGNFIDISYFTNENFFTNYRSGLSFRAERFHEIFFKLTSYEQILLKSFIAAQKMPVATYYALSYRENEYLRIYGEKVLELTLKPEKITPEKLFAVAIDTHEAVLTRGTDLLTGEKNEIISELRALKTKLDISEPGVHTKAALQLLVLLFPSVIRGIVKRDPLELAAPIGLIAADTALREVLIKLLNHPQVNQIFVEKFASKALSIATQTVERVPIVGSALAVYGLIQSGRALINTTSRDPNRPYYAHLLTNNLVTLGVMGVEMVTSLPFWPVLGLFALLTVDQIVTEGGRIHEAVLHLEDDRGHPLLRFYRKLELGLSIVDADIQVVLEQRELFNGFLQYLDKVRNVKGSDALVAVFLPAVKRVSVPAVVHSNHPPGCTVSHLSSKSPPIYPEPPFCMTHHLKVEEKGDYSYELGKLKTLCEIRDPFNVEHSNNYTLLVGSQSSDCSLGQTKTLNAAALASSKNTAGILVNNRFRVSNASNDYRLFLPIDPFLVKKYQVKLFQSAANNPHSSQILEEWLPCVNATVYCINKIRVVVTPLYSVSDRNPQEQTIITIDDDALRKGNDSEGVSVIEYLLTVTNNVHIASNQIPEKIFAFFNVDHYLKFEDNLLKSENNFQAAFNNSKKLTLEFANKAWVEGLYQVPNEQTLVINQLKGNSTEQSVILDVTQSDSFTVNLGQYTELRDKKVNISLQTQFNSSFIEVHRHNNANTFYHFLIPINKIWVVYPDNRTQLLLYSSIYGGGQEAVIIKIETSTSDNTELIFSGKFEHKNKAYFSRIVMQKKIGMQWQCNLEINASTENDTKIFDLQTLQDLRFSQVTILTDYLSSYKKTNYLFYQFRRVPIIDGKFISYRLLGTASGWLISLNHSVPNEETKCFIGESTREVIIDAIRYELNPGLASMFAIGTVDNFPISGENLIAPRKLSTSFFFNDIQILENATYKIGDLTFRNLAPNAKIYFSDETLYFAYVQYRLGINRTRNDSNYSAMNSLDGRQFLEMRPANEILVKKTGSFYTNKFLMGAMALITTFVGGTIFIFTRRYSKFAVPLGPLLNAPKASASSYKRKQTNEIFKPLTVLPKFKLFDGIENLKPIISSKYSKDFSGSVKYTGDFDTQLVLVNYLFHYTKHTKKSIKNITTKRNSYRSANETYFNEPGENDNLNHVFTNS